MSAASHQAGAAAGASAARPQTRGWTVLVGVGWCGFGRSRELLPEIRLGLVRVAWCRGWLWDAVAGWREALRAAKRDLGA